jgi:Arc/MetJ-type ribon-helix-helix transcriptional regulator
VGIRLPRPLIEEIEAWAAKNKTASRSEAIRRLVERGLGNTRPPSSQPSRRTFAKASELAGATIDQLDDKSLPPEEQAKRKRRLLKGPSEFREMRDDLPKRRR